MHHDPYMSKLENSINNIVSTNKARFEKKSVDHATSDKLISVYTYKKSIDPNKLMKSKSLGEHI